jgi:uncharacterized protein (DUF2236 family)
MVDDVLVDTEAAQDVLVSLTDPTAPPLPWMRDGLWKVMSWPSSVAGSLGTLGLLPPVLRERLGVDWDERKERRFQRIARISRASRPLMPPQARNFGPHYLKWRRKQIARGDVASGYGRRPAPA